MADYISRAAAICIADYAADEHPYEKDPEKPETCSDYNQGWNDACDYIRDRLEIAEKADVAPVRHGKWEGTADGYADGQRGGKTKLEVLPQLRGTDGFGRRY